MTTKNHYKHIVMAIQKATQTITDNEKDDEKRNREAKNTMLQFLLKKHTDHQAGKLNANEFKAHLNNALSVLQQYTGCAEDLEIFESILDTLLEKNIMTKEDYIQAINNTATNRWL